MTGFPKPTIMFFYHLIHMWLHGLFCLVIFSRGLQRLLFDWFLILRLIILDRTHKKGHFKGRSQYLMFSLSYPPSALHSFLFDGLTDPFLGALVGLRGRCSFPETPCPSRADKETILLYLEAETRWENRLRREEAFLAAISLGSHGR